MHGGREEKFIVWNGLVRLEFLYRWGRDVCMLLFLGTGEVTLLGDLGRDVGSTPLSFPLFFNIFISSEIHEHRLNLHLHHRPSLSIIEHVSNSYQSSALISLYTI